MQKQILLIASLSFSLFACGGMNKSQQAANSALSVSEMPSFNSDSAFHYMEAQVAFGPRVPNSEAHIACGNYLATQLTSRGATVTNQYLHLTAYDGKILKGRNIIGSFHPERKGRILLFAHWDSRPWADNDPDPQNHRTPIAGANDGASGVGVLLEVARLISQKMPSIGVDLLFLDAEDGGIPQFHTGTQNEDTWCLGAQYWARNPHVKGYNAHFGILLDMVGGKNATFYQESYSLKYAQGVVQKIWKQAASLGHQAYFINQEGGYVTDDHLYLNEWAGIPCVDIIPHEPHNRQSSFGSYWHTINDTMEHIDRSTLQAVGETIISVIYNEQ